MMFLCSTLEPHAIVIVRGSGDVGSAVAHALYMRGVNVIVQDEPRPAHPRRGMAFTDALFDGQAVLDGVIARHAADMESLLSIGAVHGQVPVCDLPLRELLDHFEPEVLIDSRMRKRATIEDQRRLAPTVVGLGPGFDAHGNCNIAIETAWGADLGKVVRIGSTKPLSGEPRPLAGVGRERFVYAPQAGTWHTELSIGARVEKGQPVGRVNDVAVAAPLTGLLRGLSHSGVTVAQRQKIVEVDPRLDASAFGRGERPQAIAKGVLRALNVHAEAQQQFFDFEREFEATLDCMPMSIRLKMDMCGLKLSLDQWQALPRDTRRTVMDAQCENPVDVQRLSQFIELSMGRIGIVCPPRVPVDASVWQNPGQLPSQVLDALEAAKLPHLPKTAWAALSDLQRFALYKLTAKGPTRNLRPALTEFGLV